MTVARNSFFTGGTASISTPLPSWKVTDSVKPQNVPVLFQFHGTHLFDVGHKGPAAAIQNGHFGSVHFDQGIVHATAVQGRQQVLCGVHADAALFQGGPPARFDHQVAVSLAPVGVPSKSIRLEHIAVVGLGAGLTVMRVVCPVCSPMPSTTKATRPMSAVGQGRCGCLVYYLLVPWGPFLTNFKRCCRNCAC